MFKLLITLVTFLLLAMAVMGMRHHARELESQTAGIVDQIEAKKQRLWDQRPEITGVASPTVLAKVLQAKGMVGEVGVVEGSRPKASPDDPGDLVGPLRH